MSAAIGTSATCSRCGIVIGDAAVHGLCPRCLARVAFGADDDLPTGLPPSLATLRQFGDYELLEELARGGMGIVFRARQVSLDRPVAVKLLRDGVLADAEEARRLQAEAIALAALHHPNIVGIHQVGEHEGQQFLAMELIDGRDLAELTRGGPLPVRQAVELVARVADAVQHAHDRGVLHRDLKPSNVLVDAAGVPHVTDFGVAQRVQLDHNLTLTGQVLGTPGYLSPEQAAGRSREVTAASDTYGLGALLYHLLTGRAPFVGDSPVAVLRQVEEREPVGPRLLNPAVPVDLETVVLKALAKEPARRYSSARALAEELGRYLRGEPIRARPLNPAERLWRWARRNPVHAGLTGVIGLLLLAVIGISLEANVRLRAQQQQEAQVRQFLTEVLASPDPTKDGREVRVVDLLERARRRALVELTNQPLVLAEALATLGVTYYQLALYAEAEPLLREALRRYTQELGPTSLKAAVARADLGSLLVWSSRQAEGEAELRQAVEALRRRQPVGRAELASALSELGTALQVRGHYAPAAEALREAIALCRKLGPTMDATLASAVGELSTVLGWLGQRDESIALNDEAIVINRRLPEGRVNLATCLSNQADWYGRLGRFAEAEAAAAEALRIREALFGTNSSPAAFAHARLAQVFLMASNYTAALAESERAVAMGRATLPARHRDLQFHLRQQGMALLGLERAGEAVPVLREASAIAEENFGANHSSTRHDKCGLAEALAAIGQTAEARELLAANLAVLEEEARTDPGLAYAQRQHRHFAELLARLRGGEPQP